MSTGRNVRHQYGLSTELSVNRKDGEQTLVLGGVGETQRWSHPMTPRAAQVLWFKLTVFLYPEKAPVVTSLAVTAPLRPPNEAAITTHIEVIKDPNAPLYTLLGWMERSTWKVILSELDARRLWAELDLALYPVGWEGRETRSKKLN